MDRDHIEKIINEYASSYAPIISTKDAAEIADRPLGTIYDWSSRGLFDGFKVKCGRHLRLGRDAFIRFLLTQ